MQVTHVSLLFEPIAKLEWASSTVEIVAGIMTD